MGVVGSMGFQPTLSVWRETAWSRRMRKSSGFQPTLSVWRETVSNLFVPLIL